MGNLLTNFSSRLLEKDDERSTDLSRDGKKANTEISQIGFSLIKDMINKGDELTNSDVHDYLDKADEINNEVDTVVFGLETDDNEIVKVYVACPDADAFEQAMSERLGTEDDIEDVIADLAQEYDIVDVEWPDDNEEEEDETEEDDEETETQNSSGEESSEAEAELNFDKPVIAKEQMENEMTTLGEKFKQRVLNTTYAMMEANKAEKNAKNWPPEIAGFAETMTTDAQEAILYLICLFGLPKEVLGSKKAIGEFRRNVIKAAREYTKQQTLKLWVNKLIKELDASQAKEDSEKIVKEAASEKENKNSLGPDWDDPKLLKAAKFRDTLPHGVPRLIFDTLLGLGVPEGMLTDINSSKVRNAIREFSFKVRRTQRIRIYLNLIAEALGVRADDQSDIAGRESASKDILSKHSLEEAITDPWIDTVRTLLGKLGIPQVNLGYKNAFTTRSLKTRKTQLNYASLIPKIEQFLTYLNRADRSKPQEEPITEAKSEDYDVLVRNIAIALGLPPENLEYKAPALVQAFRQRKQTLNWSSLMGRMTKLLTVIGNADTTKRESIKELTTRILSERAEQAKLAEIVTVKMKHDDEEETDVDKILAKGKKADVKKEEDPATDVGKWNFASLGSTGLTMRARGVKVQFEDIVAERIAKSIGDGKPATVKTVEGERLVFSPRDRGRSYIITGIEKFPEGVKLSSKDIDNLLDSLGSE
jgi:CRISPR/Cas system-associated protein endoribonuclease Cas2